jgi:hypothetical protein
MTYDEIPPLLRAYVGNREGFRKLGFSADDLFLQFSKNGFGVPSAFLVLRTQRKSFSIELGPCLNAQETAVEYVCVCEAMERIPQADLDRIWHESLDIAVVARLVEKFELGVNTVLR